MEKIESRHRFRVERFQYRRAAAREETHDVRIASADSNTTILSATACERCKRIKKKCDRSLPHCHLCVKAGYSCFFPRPSDVAYLNARIQWLSEFVNDVLPVSASVVESLQTGADLRNICAPNEFSSIAGPEDTHAAEPAAPTSHHSSVGGTNHDESILLDPEQEITTPLAPLPQHSNLPPIIGTFGSIVCPRLHLPRLRDLPQSVTFVTFIEVYFEAVHRSYPMLDRNEVLSYARSCRELLTQESLAMTPSNIRLYLVMALGCETMLRGKRVPSYVHALFKVPYGEVIRSCLEERSIHSIQILFLLTLHSFYDPQGWEPWINVGILSQLSIAMGLNMKSKQSRTHMLLPETEIRHRLFWCVFSIDRVISTVYGLPFTVDYNVIEIPLPGVTIDEFMASQQSDYFTTLQTTRQAIALKELHGKIFSRIHLNIQRDTDQWITRQDRHRMIESFRAQIENWYTQGCLLARLDDHQRPRHNNISSLNVSYFAMLLLLYCPSQFNSDLDDSELYELQQAAFSYIHSCYVLYQEGNVACSHNNLCRMVLTGRIILHCYTSLLNTDLLQLRSISRESIEILNNYSSAWKYAGPICLLYHRFLDFLNSLDNGEYRTGTIHSRGKSIDIDSLIDETESLILLLMGPSSRYNSFANVRRASHMRDLEQRRRF